MSIGAVIVAAGMSSRMGDFKPMLSIGSQSIARRIVSTLRQAGAEEIVMITGHNADALERHHEGARGRDLKQRNVDRREKYPAALIL